MWAPSNGSTVPETMPFATSRACWRRYSSGDGRARPSSSTLRRKRSSTSQGFGIRSTEMRAREQRLGEGLAPRSRACTAHAMRSSRPSEVMASVTTLPAKAGSFSGNAFGIPIRLRPKAPSEPQDVLCGVNVSVLGMATPATMHPIRERLLNLRECTTPTAGLRGVPRVDRDDPHPSFLRFGYEDVYELRPASIMRRLREVAPGDASNIEHFAGYQSVGIHQLACLLVVEVPTLVGSLLVQAGNLLASLAAPLRTFSLSGQGTLCPPELLSRLAVVARGLYRRTIGGHEKALQPEVDANGRIISGGFGGVPKVAGEDDVPLAARPLQGDGLDASLDRTMELDLDVPDALDVQTPVVFKLASVAVGRKLNGPEAFLSPEAGIARTLARLDPTEECFERLIQPAQRGLSRRKIEGREARENLPTLLEATRLFAVGDAAPFGLISVAPVAESKVVEPAVSAQHRVQSFYLGAVRIQPVFERLAHLAATGLLGSDVAFYRLIRDASGSAHVIRATPQGRHTASQMPVALPQDARGVALELVRQLGRGEVWRGFHEQMHVVGLYNEVFHLNLKRLRLLSEQRFEVSSNAIDQHGYAVLRAPHKVIVQVADATGCVPKLHAVRIQDVLDKTNLSNRRRCCGTSAVA